MATAVSTTKATTVTTTTNKGDDVNHDNANTLKYTPKAVPWPCMKKPCARAKARIMLQFVLSPQKSCSEKCHQPVFCPPLETLVFVYVSSLPW